MLAERIGSGPSLLPDRSRDRALSIGLSHEICGRYGLGWTLRLSQLRGLWGEGGRGTGSADMDRKLQAAYGFTREDSEKAPARVADILTTIAGQLRAQQSVGSDYLVGDSLSAGDIYAACFSNSIAPLPKEVNPMPEYLWAIYSDHPPEIMAAIDPILITHRNRIYDRHIGLPLDY
jgi:glutathione S-transferase